MNWIVGLFQRERSYCINGVTYSVEARFEPPREGRPVQRAIEHVLSSNMVDLQECFSSATMEPEYVYSAAVSERPNL